ncbi:radical SAM protein [Thermodesulfovibrio hydrogeniphilus]
MKKIYAKIDEILNSEKGVIRKDHGGKIKICLIYPDIYQVGISNLGFQTVYRLFNERKDVVCERCFLPQKEEIFEYEKGISLISYESKKPLYEFDIIAFSLCFENDYPNVIKILELAKIPYLTSERTYEYPLIIAGGVLCFSNPEPLSEVFDIVFLGEAEELIAVFVEKYKQVREGSYLEEFKQNLKKELLSSDGFYIPEAYKEVFDATGKINGRQILWHGAPSIIKRVYCRDLSNKFSYSQIVTPMAVFSEKFLIETMRGCPFSCRFCLVGQIYNPPRKVKTEILKAKIDEAISYGFSLGLIAPSLTAYRELQTLLDTPNIEISFTSLRADKHTLQALDVLSKRKTVTLAPEAGSERLRRVIKKGIEEENILNIAEKLSNTEVETLKLYFMIGLPFEKEEDIDEIVKLIQKIRAVFTRRITASISIFVPKPFTPFQWHGMEKIEIVKERLKKLSKDTLKIKGFKLLHEVPKYSYMQGYFARADRQALTIAARVSRGENFGKIFDEIKQEIYETKSFEDFLPWDFILHEGITKEGLWIEYKKARIDSE